MPVLDWLFLRMEPRRLELLTLPLGFGQPGHNVADGVPLQDPSNCLTDAELVFGLGGH